MNCVCCKQPIPEERLEALPDTTTCVRCSRVVPYTEDDIDIDGSAPEELRRIASG